MVWNLPFSKCRSCVALADLPTYVVFVEQFRWQAAAACKMVPSYIFFPEEKSVPNFKEDPRYDGVKAKDICGACPVRRMCNNFAVLHDAEGFWGGSDTRERNRAYCKEERWEMRNEAEELGKYYPLYGHS